MRLNRALIVLLISVHNVILLSQEGNSANITMFTLKLIYDVCPASNTLYLQISTEVINCDAPPQQRPL